MRRLAHRSALLLGLAACGSPPPAPALAAPASPAPEVVEVASEPGRPSITRAGELAAAFGQRIRVVGRAVDAKIAGAVLVDGEPIYCLDRGRWPEGVVGEDVEVTGVLRRTDQFTATVAEDGAISQGTAGGDLVFDECVFHLLTVDE